MNSSNSLPKRGGQSYVVALILIGLNVVPRQASMFAAEPMDVVSITNTKQEQAAAVQDQVAAPDRWSVLGSGGVPEFVRHIQPLLGKFGCSNRACHGSFQGKGGLRLSLFGSDPQLDHANLTTAERINPTDADESLIIQKPTCLVDHEGGVRFEPDSWQHRMLRSWISAGAPFHPDREAKLARLELSESSVYFTGPKETARLKVHAHFVDGSKEDVTELTQFTSNNDRTASINLRGEITSSSSGDTSLIASYGGEVVSVPVIVPYDNEPSTVKTFRPVNRLDEFIAERLSRLRLPASDISSDEEFLRRACLDISGTPPTPAEIRLFVYDSSADKRRRKIDELLDRPTYALFWATRFCDMTGLNAPLFLGNTDFGPLVGDMWYSWVERRFQENTSYDKIVEGMLTASSRIAGETYADYSARMSSYVKTQGAADFAAQMSMPHFWFRDNLKTADEKALGVAYSFLGVRLECAQCHRHPFDRWTQQDFQQFSAVFGRIQKGVPTCSQMEHDLIKGRFDAETLRTAATRRQTYWKLARQGEQVPWPEVYVSAPGETPTMQTEEVAKIGKLLGGESFDAQGEPDPRIRLMNWLRAADNPYFAPAFVNRVWTYYFGRGLVNPADDFNQANPASHPEVLAYLAHGFITSGFDMKWLHREIANSGTYQRAWRPSKSNRADERSYSHALIRRLSAEVVLDAIQQATAGNKELAAVATNRKDRRIGVQATADLRRTEYGLAVFGKPLRKVNCDCEREMDPSLLQSIYMRNDPDVEKMMDRAGGWLSELLESSDEEQLIEDAYLRVLSRFPDLSERARCRQYLLQSESTKEGVRDLLWALLNTQEFVTNH